MQVHAGIRAHLPVVSAISTRRPRRNRALCRLMRGQGKVIGVSAVQSERAVTATLKLEGNP